MALRRALPPSQWLAEHYVDEATGDPILLLHGNPTWGFLYRDVIPPLVEAGHSVIVPDMAGFGLGEKTAREGAHSLDGQIALAGTKLLGLCIDLMHIIKCPVRIKNQRLVLIVISRITLSSWLSQ
jgi:pimeloyl-ACP methyl ester carboxylesterase